MPTYSNGDLPADLLVTIGGGYDDNGYWEWQITPATLARFRAAQRYSLAKFGREIGIRTGWNVYRPLFSQQTARRNACAAGNCNGAAVAGSSSHGGNWNGRDCLAIDVDPNGLDWWQMQEACRSAGFETGLITEAISSIPGGEPWHVIDFNAFGAVPAFEGSTPLEEDDMNTEQNRMLTNIYAAIFDGGPSMPDGGASIGTTIQQTRAGIASIQRYLYVGGEDVKNGIGGTESIFGLVLSQKAQISGLTAAVGALATGAGMDPAELEALIDRAVKGAFEGVIIDTPDLTPEAIAKAVNDDADDRDRERLGPQAPAS